MRLPAGSVADALLALLKARGIDALFANSGTDFPSLIEGFARARRDGRAVPKPVLVPHEFAAVSMAHGAAMVSGRPQAAMVHVNVGTGNALAAIMNAQRAEVPIVFFAGRTPYTESGSRASRDIHSQWGQEMFDQAAMLREVVKWDYELRAAEQLETVIDRAIAIAMSEPRGPVYISLPREVLAEERPGFEFGALPRQVPSSRLHPDPDALEAAAAALASASSPLIVTSHAGRDPRAVPLLAGLAERFALPVVEFRASALCLPDEHPMNLGSESGPFVPSADAILVLESDVPWIPVHASPAGGCRVIEVAPDPLYRSYPLRGFPSDVSIACGAAAFLTALHGALERRLPDGPALAARRAAIAARSAERRARAREDLQRAKSAVRISQALALECIGAAKRDDDIVVSEYPVLMRREAIGFRTPGSYYGMSPAGALGWGLPAALGAQFARPGARVFALVGDGSYLFSNPLACHQVAASLGLPVLTVVFNNGRWDATQRYTTRMYPDGAAAKEHDFALADFQPSPRYELACEAAGGHAERVEMPGELPGALARAIEVVRSERRQALLNVICD